MDLLVEPYIYSFNHVVMSENGERPIYYKGWHQLDVLRIKAYRWQKRVIFVDLLI